MKIDAPQPTFAQAWRRVLGMQDKLHRWSKRDATARFDDLYNLVADPAFLLVAWERVSTNTGARSAGVDGLTVRAITAADAVGTFLAGLREQLKTGQFVPSPVKERLIPKSPGKYRRLGIPTVADRVVQASLVLVLEPIFEADFHPSSYGFRPKRRTMDAVAEIQMFASRSYEWVLEGDIRACFDEIDHAALLGRVRRRIGDKRVLALVKAFLKAGVLSEDQALRENNSGTPQGGILSPLLANIALEVLDEYFARLWNADSATRVDRSRRRRHGLPTYRLVRYADDFVVLVSGTREHAEAIKAEVAAVLSPVGLSLSPEKTTVVHIDEGFDFLGFRIQRHPKRGTA
nr:group II intron reverse transcriptase/maturase [Micropruina sp.]